MAKFFLHIGSPKTASTSLQDFFFCDLHNKKKINYLGKRNDYELALQNQESSHYCQVFQKINNALLWEKDFLKNLSQHQSQINSIVDNQKINVYSEEVLFNRDNTRCVIPFSERLQRIQTLLQNHSVKVFCVLRKQAEQVFSRYIQNFSNQWYYTKHNNTIEKYYKNLISNSQELDLMTSYCTTLEAYKNAFGGVYCLFFEELLADEFSYYQKIAKFLEVKINKKDIPQKRKNERKKNNYGYITVRSFHHGGLIKNQLIEITPYKVYRDLLLNKIMNGIPYALYLCFFRYNIILAPPTRRRIRNELMKMFHFLKRFLQKPIMHPYFTKEQKQTILRLCKKNNQELANKKFCKKEDLKKYGYL